MLARISTFLCGGLLFGLLAPIAAAQAPAIEPEIFKNRQSQEAALPRLMEALKSPDEKVRAKAIVTLGSFGPVAKTAAPALAEVAVNSRGHALALQALAKIDEEATRKALRQLLASVERRCKCGLTFNEVVAAAGEPIVPHLTYLLAEPAIATNVERTLVGIGEPAVPHLVRVLENRCSLSLRPAVCRVFAQLGPKAKAAAPALEKRMALESGSLKLRVAQALYVVSGSHKAALDVLHQAVRRDDKADQKEAVVCLFEARVKSKELVAAVLSYMMNADRESYGYASAVLVHNGPDAVPALIAELSRDDAKQRDRLVETLHRIGPAASAAIPLFIKLLASNDHVLAAQVAEILPMMGPQAKRAIPQLLVVLNAGSTRLSLVSAHALARIDREQIPHTIGPLVEALSGKNENDRSFALEILNSFGPQAKAAAPALKDLLKTESVDMRVRVANVLSHIDPSQLEAALPSLIEGLQPNQGRSGVRWTALQVMGQMGPRAKSAAPALKNLLLVSIKKHGAPIRPQPVIACMKKIDASAEIMSVMIEALNSADSEEREEAMFTVEDFVGVSALASLEGAMANGQLRDTPELTELMKHLRQRSAKANK